MPHRDYIVIQKILAEIDLGLDMLGDTTQEEFLQDEELKRAVAMTVINIGELIKNVTQETRSAYPDVPWRAAAGMRDIAAHKYQTLRMEDVYQTATQDFQELRKQLGRILAETGEGN